MLFIISNIVCSVPNSMNCINSECVCFHSCRPSTRSETRPTWRFPQTSGQCSPSMTGHSTCTRQEPPTLSHQVYLGCCLWRCRCTSEDIIPLHGSFSFYPPSRQQAENVQTRMFILKVGGRCSCCFCKQKFNFYNKTRRNNRWYFKTCWCS